MVALSFPVLPVSAARPLLDKHQWDAYFALFARDAALPWQPAVVRLDTYSGAALDFAAYAVDPADVIVAGSSRAARAVDTSRRRPVVRWRFSPPPGYSFQSSEVHVPLGGREGFYVIEARRGDAVQQVWLNRSHLGLVTKESPEGLLVWAVDLRTGRAISGLSLSFLVGRQLVVRRTDPQGIVRWRDRVRPAFVLAESGDARAFVSILPQAPLPASLVGVRLEAGVARAGQPVRFVGFVRQRSPGGYRAATGDVRITLAGYGTTLATALARLDAAGAFAGLLTIPEGARAGEYALLASAAGGIGGTDLHVDATGDVSLSLDSSCPCDPQRDVPFEVVARRGTQPVAEAAVRVQIVRTPHVLPAGSNEGSRRWGTTVVYDRTVRTGPGGRARIVIPSPSDGLDSTYGIAATAAGATVTSRIVVPAGRVALLLEPQAGEAGVGEPVSFDIRGFDATDGAPAAALEVAVRLSHGASMQERTVRLDGRGAGHVTFTRPYLGANLALAEATVDGRRILDAAAVVVVPGFLSRAPATAGENVSLSLDKPRYRAGDRIAVRVAEPGALGDALLTLEGAQTYAVRLTNVESGSARGSLDLGQVQGAVRVGVALVRDGSIATGSANVRLDEPGHVRATELSLDKSGYAPGDVLHATIQDANASGGATIALRVADGQAGGFALFDDAPGVLESGATIAQVPASANPGWHAYVAPARSRASDIFAAERPRKVATDVPAIGVAAPHTLLWTVGRAAGPSLDVPVPHEPGRYVLSILKISDDGEVGAASTSFTVR